MTSARPPRGRPWSPFAVGLAAGLGLELVSLVLTLAFGWAGSPFDLEFWRGPRGWFDAVMAGLFGWGIGGGTALVRGAHRDLSELRPALRPGTPTDELDPFPARALGASIVGGIALGFALNFAPGNWPEGIPGASDPLFVWSTLRTMAVTCAIIRAGTIATRIALYSSRLGPALRIDDLLDLRSLAPLGRGGLRNVAVWVGISAFFGAMMIAPFGRSVAAANLVLSAAIGLLAFLAPVRGAHARLVETRDAELVRIRTALRDRTGDGAAPSDDRFSALSLADLLAWEERIERVRTWPFDASTLLRFAFYIAIGLGSWVGAALVERALGAALG